MIAWWWLVIEFAALLVLAALSRGAARTMGMCDALEDPDKARAEIARRWKTTPANLLYRYRARLP